MTGTIHNHYVTMNRILITLISSLLLSAVTASAQSLAFIDYGKAEKFIDIDAHLLFGGSYVSNNYNKCYSEISDLNSTMGFAYGAGVGVKFNFTNFIGLGTQFNYTFNKGKMDMAVTREGAPNVSNVFLRNSYRNVDIPIYMSFTFNLASRIRWEANGGMYLGFGSGGSQKTTIYNAKVNELGQLLTTVQHLKAGYYNDDKAFINSYKRNDMGLYIGTGLIFYDRISINAAAHIGLSNVAKSSGIVKPSAHNFKVFGSIGYHF